MKLNKKTTILLIDDDDATNYLNGKLLDSVTEDVDVKTFLQAPDALEYLESISSDTGPRQIIVFLDINMPGMDGFKFLEILEKRNYPNLNIPVIFLTSSVSKIDMYRAKHHELYDYIVKPLKSKHLESILPDLNVPVRIDA